LLVDGKMNAGLPPMLVGDAKTAGVHSGMMLAQYTAAALVLENQGLANPDSVRSLPTSAGKEDHNANAMTAARHAWEVACNSAHVLAIELYCAARALDLRLQERPKTQMGAGTAKAHAHIREAIPFQAADALWGPEIETVREMLQRGELDIPSSP
jgi:histidine ammonia-lyase